MPSTAALIAEAMEAPIRGWDFSWMQDRITSEPLPWDYAAIVTEELARTDRWLDMGTGGGEVLSSFPPARLTVAAESWPPNVPVAGRRLHPLGIRVVQDEGARGNWTQDGGEDDQGRLPFRAGCFDLVTNRHEAYVAAEVADALAPGGHFVTQQAGQSRDQFHALLGLPFPERETLDIDRLIAQVHSAGLTVLEAQTGVEVMTFADIGAVVFYLRMIPWTVPDFDLTRHRAALEKAAGRPFVVYNERLLLHCRK
jgi:SAM-dependent methyltransferase